MMPGVAEPASEENVAVAGSEEDEAVSRTIRDVTMLQGQTWRRCSSCEGGRTRGVDEVFS